MEQTCSCGGRLGNTGIDNCVIEFKTTNNFILVSTYKADSTKNFIDMSSPATLGATVLALTQSTTDSLERLYPLPFAENITREKTDRLTDTAPSGNIYNVQDGLRQNKMEFYGQNASFSFMRELDKFGCTKLSYYSVDVAGTIEGFVDIDEPTKFYPIPMMENSFYGMVAYATDTAIQKLPLDFNMKRNFDESQIYYLTAVDLGYPATELVGLIPVTVTVSAITDSGATLTVLRPSQSAVATRPLTGLVPGDFAVYDVTNAAIVSVLTSPEVTPGVYALTYAPTALENNFTATANKAGFAIEVAEYVDPA
jgi:hypothetical protein